MRSVLPLVLALLVWGCATQSGTEATSGVPETTAAPATTGTPGTTAAPVTTEAPAPETTASGGSQIIVAISEFSFAPPTLTVSVGDSITWRNDGSLTHTSSSTDNWDSGAITPGTTFIQTFDTPGTFTYICRFHPNQMGATVTVEG